jgi:uncharacterized membrane protein YcaP (DUF421 family)
MKEQRRQAELLGKLRHEGARDVAEVEEAWMDADGEVSVVLKQQRGTAGRRTSRRSGRAGK